MAERTLPDAGDRITIDRAGNGQCRWSPDVSRDGDCAVIGGVNELGLHHGGNRHKQQHQGKSRVKCSCLHGHNQSLSTNIFISRFLSHEKAPKALSALSYFNSFGEGWQEVFSTTIHPKQPSDTPPADLPCLMG